MAGKMASGPSTSFPAAPSVGNRPYFVSASRGSPGKREYSRQFGSHPRIPGNDDK
jgi:hypothetical protein